MSTTRPLRVMQSVSALRDTTNPYLKQLLIATSTDDCRPRTFSWSAALRGDFDVLHVHWPEVMVRGRGRHKTWGRRIAFALLLLRLRSRRRVLVRTLHNLAPHESGSHVERWLLRRADRTTGLWITLVPSTPVPVDSRAPRRTIPHGDYRDWFADVATDTTPVPGRLLYFGLVRPYKGVEDLLGAFVGLRGDTGWAAPPTLRIVGSAPDPYLASRITALAATDPAVDVRLEYVSDPELAAEVRAADIVVLPYREMHNSGSALLALSLGRPILVPDNEVTRDLADEVGPGWVHRFPGDLTTDALRRALRSVAAGPPAALPHLDLRRWSAVGAAHVAAYHAAADARRARS